MALGRYTINNLDVEAPTGSEMVSEVDNFIRSTRQWVETCLKDISGYPDNAYLKIPKWANNSGRPSPKEGFMGFNDNLHKFEYFNGTSWVPLEYWA